MLRQSIWFGPYLAHEPQHGVWDTPVELHKLWCAVLRLNLFSGVTAAPGAWHRLGEWPSGAPRV